MILSKIDDFTNSIFRDLNGNFNWKILVALLIGVLIGLILAATIYGILLLISIKKTNKKVVMPAETNEDLINTINLMKKDFINITSGFNQSEKVKVLGNTLMNTIKLIASTYYPESKYPLYELNISELVVLLHYITNRIDEIFDKNILKLFKNMSISNVFKILDIHKKINDNKAVKAVKKVNPVVKVIKGIVNYANPLYWIKKLVVGGTINIAVNKMSLLIIDIVSSETIKVYSKRLFNEENNLLEEMINKEIEEMEELE